MNWQRNVRPRENRLLHYSQNKNTDSRPFFPALRVPAITPDTRYPSSKPKRATMRSQITYIATTCTGHFFLGCEIGQLVN